MGNSPDDRSIAGWYSHFVEKILSSGEIYKYNLHNIHFAFDPVHALIIENILVKKIGEEKWKNMVEEADGHIAEFSELVRKYIYVPDSSRSYVFHDNVWNLLPTCCKSRNYIRAKFTSKGLEDYLKSDIFEGLVDAGNIIAFRDGVIDTSRIDEGIRKGKPCDFTTIPLDYEIGSEPEPQQQKELDRFLECILPDKDTREYLLYHLASCMSRGNLDKVFVVWHGEGNNGKSVLESLVEHTLGNYCYKAPTSLFSCRRTSSSSATPETARLDRYLLSFIQESDEKEVVNIGTLKELTGNDTIYSRELYSQPKTVDVRCKFILVTNKIYNMTQADEATWARIRVIPFKSKFTLNPEEVDEKNNIYLTDPKYIKRIKDLAPCFMKLLIKYYKNYLKNGGLPEDKKVRKETEAFRKYNSPVSMFVDDRLVSSIENSIKVQETYEEYRKYSRKNCGVRNSTLANFLIEMGKLNIKPCEGSFIGYYLKREF